MSRANCTTPVRFLRSVPYLRGALAGLLVCLWGATFAPAQSIETTPATTTPLVTTPDKPAEPAAAGSDAGTEASQRVAAKVVRYAQRFVSRYDTNHNGQLERQEWPAAMQEKLLAADLNHDGILDVAEYARYISDYSRQRRIRLLPPQSGDLAELAPLLNPTTAQSATFGTSPLPAESAAVPATTPKPAARRDTKFYVAPDRLPKGLPDWFFARDRDGDGQLTILEYSPKGIPAELQQFKQLDRNGDGLLTPDECLAPAEKKADKKSEKAASKPAP